MCTFATTMILIMATPVTLSILNSKSHHQHRINSVLKTSKIKPKFVVPLCHTYE